MLGLARACRADSVCHDEGWSASLVLLEEALLRREGLLLHLRLQLDAMLAVLPLHTGGVAKRGLASRLAG